MAPAATLLWLPLSFPKMIPRINMKELKMESWSKTNWRSSPHGHSQWLLASHGPSSPRNTCFGGFDDANLQNCGV